MPSLRITKENRDQLHFVTCTIQSWYYLFDRHNRWEILAESLNYCRKYKGLKIYSYVFMLNHIHMIISAPDLIQVINSFKQFTSKSLMKNILATEPHAIKLFPKKNGKYKIWQETNYPECIETEKFLIQKTNYIHNNPLKKSYVTHPEHWFWSSAHPEQPIKLNTFE